MRLAHTLPLRLIAPPSSAVAAAAALLHSDSIDSELADSKIRAQWPLARKAALADIVLDNSGTIAELHAKVDAWLEAQKRQSGWRRWIPTIPTVLLVALASPILLSATAFYNWITPETIMQAKL